MLFRGPLIGPDDYGYNGTRASRTLRSIASLAQSSGFPGPYVIDGIKLAREHELLLLTVRAAGHHFADHGPSMMSGAQLEDMNRVWVGPPP